MVGQKNLLFRSFLFLVLGFSLIFAQPEPETFFGFKPGSDRQLFDYEKLIAYFKALAKASDRVKLVQIGYTPLNRPMFVAFISAKDNIANLERLREINRKLALDPSLKPEEVSQLVEEGRVFVLATLSMHSGEVGPSQAAPLIAYELATSNAPEVEKVLNDVVFMMVPSQNPDGMDMVVHHYQRYKGTKYEGSSLPGVYHKYVGHDNNRDYVTLSQQDTRAIARLYNKAWMPQVVVEKHQMGARGPRYFVPPMHDPIAENVDAAIWNWTWIFGSNMVKDMTAAGLAGVTQHYLFDDYWPGSTETSNWKNCISLLTECASAKYATPVYVEPTELSVAGKGISEYKKSINMSLPWPGGWWHLSDIVRYEIESTRSILKTASLHRAEILKMRNDLCKKEVQRGKEDPPFYFVFPVAQQHDPSELVALVRLLLEHGVHVYRATKAMDFGDVSVKEGDIVVPLSQPFRPFIKEVLEAQKYPLRHYTPGGKIIRPYDITSWSLPLHRGLRYQAVNVYKPFPAEKRTEVDSTFTLFKPAEGTFAQAILDVRHNDSFKAAFQALKRGKSVKRLTGELTVNGQTIPKGSFVIEAGDFEAIKSFLTTTPIYLQKAVEKNKTEPLRLPRIALVETFFHDMDAGWTRFIFDTYGLPFKVLRPAEIAKTDLKKFDVLIFPDASKSILMEGKYKSGKSYYMSTLPPAYAKGMGKKGLQNVLKFLDSGGHILAWGRSTELFMGLLQFEKGKDKKESFQLPVRNVASDLQKKGLYIPGSLIRLKLIADHPLTLGLPQEIGVFSRGRPVFQTSIPNFDMDRRVVGYYPEEKLLLSGYAEKAELMGNKAGLVWLKKNKGQLVLFAFQPQFRASTQGTFKLLFNALLLK